MGISNSTQRKANKIGIFEEKPTTADKDLEKNSKLENEDNLNPTIHLENIPDVTKVNIEKPLEFQTETKSIQVDFENSCQSCELKTKSTYEDKSIETSLNEKEQEELNYHMKELVNRNRILDKKEQELRSLSHKMKTKFDDQEFRNNENVIRLNEAEDKVDSLRQELVLARKQLFQIPLQGAHSDSTIKSMFATEEVDIDVKLKKEVVELEIISNSKKDSKSTELQSTAEKFKNNFMKEGSELTKIKINNEEMYEKQLAKNKILAVKLKKFKIESSIKIFELEQELKSLKESKLKFTPTLGKLENVQTENKLSCSEEKNSLLEIRNMKKISGNAIELAKDSDDINHLKEQLMAKNQLIKDLSVRLNNVTEELEKNKTKIILHNNQNYNNNYNQINNLYPVKKEIQPSQLILKNGGNLSKGHLMLGQESTNVIKHGQHEHSNNNLSQQSIRVPRGVEDILRSNEERNEKFLFYRTKQITENQAALFRHQNLKEKFEYLSSVEDPGIDKD